ncbi:glycerate kinase [bacterium]|nr:glycerate kinase [bacterium]
MKIVVCPDSFKGSLPAWQVAEAISKGLRCELPEAEVIELPLADGGEGTAFIMAKATNGKLIRKKVTGPLGEKVNAHFALLGDGKTAVVEMAQAAGLSLVPPKKRNPLKTTTYGVGELIKFALDEGVERIIVGIGGSATNDAGIGMAQAIGFRILDENGEDVPLGGEGLLKMEKIEIDEVDKRLQNVKIIIASDVQNTLLDAARVYAPQKGAKAEDIILLEEGLRRFAEVVRRCLGKDVLNLPGGGAAGGLGAGLVAFLNATPSSGIDTVLDYINFDEKVKGSDLIITGEGKLDKQTAYGKAISGAIRRAQGKPVIALAGEVEEGLDLSLLGITSALSIVNGPMTLRQAMKKTPLLLESTAREIAKILKIGGMLYERA